MTIDFYRILNWLLEPGLQTWIEVFILLGTLTSFWLIPSALGNGIWLFPAWFAVVNILMLSGVNSWSPDGIPVIILTVIFVPIMGLAFLGNRVKAFSGEGENILKVFLLWQGTRFTGLHFLFGAYAGSCPGNFALESSFSEGVTALGALFLWIFFYPKSFGWRMAVLLWNTYGLLSASGVLYKLFFSHPQSAWLAYTPDIYHYNSGFPQYWQVYFWLPIFFASHLVLFYLVKPLGEKSPIKNDTVTE